MVDYYGHHYRTTIRKNVAPFSGKRRNYEHNFTRALISLKVRGFIEGKTGYYSEVRLTEAGRKEAQRFTEDGAMVPPKKSGE